MSDMISRRRFGQIAGIAVAGLGFGAVVRADDPPPANGKSISKAADEILKDLLEGNRRFVEGKPINPRRSPADYRELAEAQFPEAVIVGCADSRVAPEILF